MKNLFHIFLCSFVGILLSVSCTKDLTLQPVSLITNASFWKSKDEAEGALNGMYVRLRNQSNINLFTWGEARSEIWTQNFGFDASIHFPAFANDLTRVNPGPDWTGMYSVIHDANLILKYVPQIEFVDQSDKDLILAQAYSMRAFVYFTLTKVWGDLILIEEPTEGFDSETIFRERSSQEDVFELIKSDLENALNLYPNNDFPAGRNKWSRPATNALKADVYMWTGKLLGGGNSDFNTVLSAIEEIEESDVELLDEYESIFDYNNKGNKEILMAVRYEVGESSTRTVYGGITTINAPTFPFTDQETIDKISPFQGKNVHWQVRKEVADQFNDNDSRKEGNFVEVYQTRDGVTSFMYVADVKWDGTLVGGVRQIYDDYIIYRYADIILLKAEAKNALDQDPSDEINKIRLRAYGPEFENHRFENRSKEENDEIILQERLFELMHEGKRWWDLVRFGKALETVPGLVGEDENSLLFPIGESILSLEPLVEQNPGY